MRINRYSVLTAAAAIALAAGAMIIVAIQLRGPEVELAPFEQAWIDEYGGNIRYAPLPDAPPFDYLDKEGKHQGITREYAELIQGKTGLKFKTVKFDTMQAVKEAWEDHEIDLIGSLQDRSERQEHLRFTDIYYSVDNAIFMRKGAVPQASTLEELEDARIAIVEGSATYGYVTNRYPDYDIVAVTNVAHGFDALYEKKVHAMITDKGVGYFYIEQRAYPDIELTGLIKGYSWDLRFATHKQHPALYSIINKALDAITPLQRYVIHSRWMSNTEKHQRTINITIICLLLTLLGAVGITVWNRILKKQVRHRTHELGRARHSQEQATQALGESEERFRAMVESSNDMIWEMDRLGNYTYVSPRARDILGREPQQVIGLSSFSLMIPADSAAFLQMLRKADTLTTFDCLVNTHLHADGHEVILETSGLAYSDNTGQLAGFRGVSRDITDRIEAEAALRDSEERFRNLVETTSDWIWETDTKGHYTYASPQVRELLGYAPEELIGRRFTGTMPEKEAASVHALFKDISSQGAPIHSLVNINRHKDGRKVVLETSAVPFYDKDWNIQGYRGIDRDITERTAAEKQLEFERTLFRSFMEHVPYLIYFKDSDGRFIEVNAAKAAEVHLRPDELVGQTDFDFYPADQAQRRYEDELEVMRTEKPVQKEEFCTTADGDRWYLTTLIPRYDEEGSVAGTFGTSWDITYRKQAGEELRRLRAQLSNVIDSMPSILVGVGADGLVTQWNREAESTTGTSASDAVGRPLREIFPTLSKEMIKVERAIRERTTQKEERIPEREDGHTRYSDITVYPLLENDAEGAVIRIDDVTDRVLIEDSIRNIVEGVSTVGRRFFNSMVKQLAKSLDADVTFISEYGGVPGTMRTIAVCNGGEVTDNFEYSLEDTPCLQVMETRASICASDIIDRYPDSGFFRSIQAKEYIGIPLIDSEGEARGCMVALYKSPVEHLDFATSVMQVFAGRTTAELERLQATKELLGLRNLLANIIDSMPSILVGVDAEGCVMQWNREAERVTGTPAEEANGQPLESVFISLGEEMDRIVEAIGRRELRHDERIPCTIAGDARFTDVTVYPLSTDGIEGAVIRVDDITDRVRIEEMMVQTEKMMSVGGLAAGMAHEINNPLAGILQNLQVMRNRITQHTERNLGAAAEAGTSLEALQTYMHERGLIKMMDSITEAGRRAARIVDNMLSFSRKDEAHYVPNDLRDVLERSIELAANDYDLKKRFDFRHIQVNREYDDSVEPVPCEASQIQQVILNLLSNSAQAMAEHPDQARKPAITLRLKREPEMLLIEVEDNGPGMDADTRKRVFEPFFTTKEVGRGTGLGLSVSYFIITENHGGTMRVRSFPGYGTCFSIRIPYEHRQVRWGLRL
jgi:PAS domain S-box-containing protein